jgi:hypothetical protein
MGWTSPEAREVFQWFVKHEAERRSRDRQKVSEVLQTVPASQETLDKLGALSPEDAERALRMHPGHHADRKIESVCTMLELFRRALADLAAAMRNSQNWVGLTIGLPLKNWKKRSRFASTKSCLRFWARRKHSWIAVAGLNLRRIQ